MTNRLTVFLDIDMHLPIRKNIRVNQYDYSQNGSYFITICTKERKNYFWTVGTTSGRPTNGYELSGYGIIAEKAILNISSCYPDVAVDKYVIMPDHLHLLISIQSDNGRAMRAPTISTIIGQMKGYVSKQIGETIWQKRFFDHIIRNEQDYNETWRYIENNPLKYIITQ